MRVSIFGLGYVGAVTAACLARDGHEVIGVDVNPDKVALVAAGRAPFIEPGLDELLADAVPIGPARAPPSTASAAVARHRRLARSAWARPARRGRARSLAGHDRSASRSPARSPSQSVTMCSSCAAPFRRARSSAARDLPASAAATAACTSPSTPSSCARARPSTTTTPRRTPSSAPTTRSPKRSCASSTPPIDAPVIVVAPGGGRDGQVRGQRLARHQDRLRQRGRPAGQGVRRRRARGHGRHRPGHEAQRLGRLPASRASPTAARACPRTSRTWQPGRRFDVCRCRCSPRCRSATRPRSSSPSRPCSSTGRARVAVLRPGLQGRHRRPAREPRGAAGEAAARRGLRGPHLSTATVRKAHLMGTNLAYIREHVPHFEGLLVDGDDGVAQWADVVVVTYRDARVPELLAGAGRRRRCVDLAGVTMQPPATVSPEADGICLVASSSSSRTCRCRSTGGSGWRPPRCGRRATTWR